MNHFLSPPRYLNHRQEQYTKATAAARPVNLSRGVILFRLDKIFGPGRVGLSRKLKSK